LSRPRGVPAQTPLCYIHPTSSPPVQSKRARRPVNH
jgi:hypothetical protein